MHSQMVNGALAAENITDRLNAHERTLRWKEGSGEEREELIRSADYFSPAGTAILRRVHGVVGAFVIDDGERYRYVVAREVLGAPEPLTCMGRLRRWVGDAPIRWYGQWRVTGEESAHFLPPSRTKEFHRLADGMWISYRKHGNLKVGGWPELLAWLRAFPGRFYRRKAMGRWHVAGPVLNYYVDPDFYEPMAYDDFVDYLQNRYPPHPSSDPDAVLNLDVCTGRVSFRNPDHALEYARDLKRKMYELGVLCSPVTGVGGYTDRHRRPDDDKCAEWGGTCGGLPKLAEFGRQGLIFDLSTLERRRQRCAELESRLGDANIPGRRKAEISRALREEQEREREATRSLETRPQEEIYGLALGLAWERDQIAKEKRHVECLLDGVREGLIL